MATGHYYMIKENSVIEMEMSLGDLLNALQLEVSSNSDTGKLDPQNYKTQDTLAIKLANLAKTANQCALYIQAHGNDAFYRQPDRATRNGF